LYQNRRQERREEAKARHQARENRGHAGQLARLEQQGFGECKEAQRLRRKLNKIQTPEEAPKAELEAE